MAQATYTTDLVTLTQNATSTNMVEPTATTPESWVNLNALTSAETDYYIQGATCTSATIKVGVGGLLYNNGAGFTIPTDGAVLCWSYFWAPGVLDTEAGGGARQMIGSSQAAFYWVTHLGSDTWTYGGWQCFAMADPAAITVNTVGTPTATRQYTGWAYDAPTTVPGKGNPYGIDAIRYGRCTIQVTNGDATEYGRFDIIAEFNDKNTTAARTGFTLLDTGFHRLGVFQYQDGAYRWQGRLLLGTTATPVDFRDSNRAITCLNTKHVTANFNLIEVQNAASRVDWTGISISKVGTVGKGRFLMTDNADVNKASCTFTDMDTFVYQSNATILDSIFRRCGQVTLGGATMTGCAFDQSTAAIALACGSSVSGLSDTSFVSDGTGHAIEITGGTTHTLTGITFTGYAASNGSTGNESVYVNVPSGAITIYADSSFSYRTAGASVTIIAGAKTATVTVTNDLGSPISGASVAVYAKDATGSMPYKASVTITNSGTTATVTHTAHPYLTNDKALIEGASHWQNNGVFSITVTGVNSYTYTLPSAPGSNPTGTITSTYAAIFGLTDANGQISVTRVFGGSQPIVGWARKSTSSPYYKSGPVTGGPISSTVDTSMSALLLSDE